ncbi:uncharacterized protein TOT_040000361 [Theileria orientalis strain Shintoku]|uniref:Spen paralogue and orthologue SPOC C-terminal domain-containing protein n=1 Tax=Theileria orientalis strain Shintoku TaxID=869250 RepID=J4CDZ1_THEOR|nr:uncharacterized protein TOT_040000361 [Theileria orientalis strain Shintoku]BAM41982.1 uncharacterized protein TOT_040000361 [Theileria orientalis strain Shintoku]|eukprot:XP_009692283.1 uncharacterized protein TOT_040000361 [Theileria orientalis strain Shintoku]
MVQNPEYSQAKVKVRLCEQLRVHAPHIFSRRQASQPDSYQKYPKKFQDNANPPFNRGPPFHNQPPAHDPDPPYSNIPEPPEPPKDFSIYSRTNLVWQGNIARNSKKLTETLAIKISGQCSHFLTASIDIINITHRLKWEEASKNVPLAVFSLHSSNNLKLEPFNEYIEYFKTKNRIGVAPLGNDHNIYICAPGNPLFDKHMPGGITTPTLIGIVVANEAITTNQPGRLQQSNGDWLNQLNNITAMLGTKK